LNEVIDPHYQRQNIGRCALNPTHMSP